MRLRNIVILAVILAVLVGVFYLVSRSEPTAPPKSIVYVWHIEDMNYITHVTISLPGEDLSQSFIKIPEGDKFPWHFDDRQKSKVDADRWSGGIPLLLTGPGADRIISQNASEAKLAEYGLLEPRMEITITLTDNSTLKIAVGDSAPASSNYYVRAPGSNAVATVDYTWYEVLERLVKEPPYATGS